MRFIPFIALLLLPACKVQVPNVNFTMSGDGSSNTTTVPYTLSCTAVANGGLPVKSGDAVSVLVSVNGTYGPFSSSEITGTFSASGEVFRSYKNIGSTQETQTDSIIIKDGNGNSKSCTFNVVVLPLNPPSNLICTLTPDKAVYTTNETVNLTLTGSGSTAPYAFSNLTSSGTITKSITTSSTISASAAVAYSQPGLKNISAQVTDSLGDTSVCLTTIQVQNPVVIPTPPPCTVVLSQNPAFIGEGVVVTGVPGASPSVYLGPAQLIAIQSTWESGMQIWGRVSDTQGEVAFYESGMFPVIATMQYLYNGQMVQCTTMQTVYGGYWY
ncbi:MAG: hypothetical protein HYR96_03370 [Deltaproteobacteria bacterium]|nr:hypothetical protein [Deltaproteobacteria bacterium]MBI3294278.1 hypothetical protein [Deltaproteobacteria bacterium]